MSELSDYLAQDPEDFHEEAWRVTGFETATWAMRKLKAAQERLDDINRQALDEAAKISDWANHVSKVPLRDKIYFESALQDYIIRLREETGEKSVVLPDGEVTSRSIAAKAQVADKELFLKWATNNERGQWLRTKVEVNLEALKDAVEFSGDAVVDKVTGEIVEGLVAIDADVSVKVTVSHS